MKNIQPPDRREKLETEAVEELLRGGLLEPPAGFAARVMAAVAQLPSPEVAPSLPGRPATPPPGLLAGIDTLPRRAGQRWLGLLGAATAGMAGLAGFAQLLLFGFGIWQTTAAG